MSELFRIHPNDNVAVATVALESGASVQIGQSQVTLRNDVMAGHKVALVDLPAGASVIKYGFPIGKLTAPVQAGEWIHSHNLATALDANVPYTYEPAASAPAKPSAMPTFMGYRRKNGRVGTRNEIWIIN